MANYDVVGNIVIVKFQKGVLVREKKKWALDYMKKHKHVRTVLEKSGRFSGRLRTQKTKWIAGEKNGEALYRENGCVFRLNVDSCYFSPRLAAERMEIAEKVKKEERILVMFGGIGVYAIVIGRNTKAKGIVSVELGRECNKYARENVKRNKLSGKVDIIQGDVRGKVKGKFDRIVMARPNLKESFLDVAFSAVKKGGIIHYYGFYTASDKEKMKEMIMEEAKKAKRKIRFVRIKKAGEIRIREYRFRADFKVLN